MLTTKAAVNCFVSQFLKVSSIFCCFSKTEDDKDSIAPLAINQTGVSRGRMGQNEDNAKKGKKESGLCVHSNMEDEQLDPTY